MKNAISYKFCQFFVV